MIREPRLLMICVGDDLNGDVFQTLAEFTLPILEPVDRRIVSVWGFQNTWHWCTFDKDFVCLYRGTWDEISTSRYLCDGDIFRLEPMGVPAFDVEGWRNSCKNEPKTTLTDAEIVEAVCAFQREGEPNGYAASFPMDVADMEITKEMFSAAWSRELKRRTQESDNSRKLHAQKDVLDEWEGTGV